MKHSPAKIGCITLLTILSGFLSDIQAQSDSTKKLFLGAGCELWGWMPDYEAAQLNRVDKATFEAKMSLLDYYASLGVTHVVYQSEIPYNYPRGSHNFSKSRGRWVYNPDADGKPRYRGCDIFDGFKNMKKATDANGLELIPMLKGISHAEEYTNLDPSICEVSEYRNLTMLQTRSADRNTQGSYSPISFKVDKECYVYIAYDNTVRDVDRPDWIKAAFRSNPDEPPPAHWLHSSQSEIGRLETESSSYVLLRSLTTYAAHSTVTLNGNAGKGSAANMYVVFLAGTNPSDGTIPVSSCKGCSAVTYSLSQSIYSDKTVTSIRDVSYPIGWDLFALVKKIPRVCSKMSVQVNNNNVHDIFNEQLNIIKAVYSETTAPQFIHLASDELGAGDFCFVASDKSAPLLATKTKSQLVAEEINYRIERINAVFGSKVRVILWGDSFLPGDWGEVYGLAGDLSKAPEDITYGKNGVLDILDKTYNKKGQIVIAPWMYSVPHDGNPRSDCTDVRFDKHSQLRYLDKMGYDYIFAAGEDGGVGSEQNVKETMQCTYEWFSAAHMYPGHFLGAASATWSNPNVFAGATNNEPAHFDPNPEYIFSNAHSPYNNLKVNYSAALVKYLLTYPYIAPASSNAGNYHYSNGVFSGVNFVRCRNDREWVKGKHYATGLGLQSFTAGKIAADNIADGTWSTPYSAYTLSGKGTFNAHEKWNGSFAFAQLNEFDFKVHVASLSNARDAGILIRQSIQGDIKDSPYLELFFDNKEKKVCIGSRDVSGFKGYMRFSEARYLRAVKQAGSVKMYSSKDGITYTLLGEYSYLSGDVFAGMSMSPNNLILKGNAIFTDVVIDKNGK